MQIYLVGGAVRDQLLGLAVKERDWVVVGATPEQMIAQGFKPVGKDFPVFLHPKTNDEYALARTERKSGQGYHGFTCYAAPDVSLEADLKRRDLTINAMAQTADGKIIDPYGGQEDLAKGILRHVSPAFREDPVRILRVARFMARFFLQGFVVDEDTGVLMREMVRLGEVSHLQGERIWQELDRALGEVEPSAFFQILRDCGALKVLFPEIDNLFGVPNPPQWHPEIDSGVHTLRALRQAAKLSTSRTVRFATLVHDLGKALTPQEAWPRHPDHGERGVAAIEALCDRYPVPKRYRELAVLISRYHIFCHRCLDVLPKTLLNFLEEVDAFRRPERFYEFLLVCRADFWGRNQYLEPSVAVPEYRPQIFLEEIMKQLNTIQTQELLAQGITGLALKDALRKRRYYRIKQVKKNFE